MLKMYERAQIYIITAKWFCEELIPLAIIMYVYMTKQGKQTYKSVEMCDSLSKHTQPALFADHLQSGISIVARIPRAQSRPTRTSSER